MAHAQVLEPYSLTGPKKALLEQCAAMNPAPHPTLQIFQNRPRPSHIRNRILDLHREHPGISDIEPAEKREAIYRSINRAWEEYTVGLENSSAFMRTPVGAAYEVVSIPGKGRGLVASRDIGANELILQESPILIAPHGEVDPRLLLLLPKAALEAVLLLHNAHPNMDDITRQQNIPHNHLLQYLMGIMTSNAFDGHTAYGMIGLLLLTGSLFNHDQAHNVTRTWDQTLEQEVFTTLRNVRKGEELTVTYTTNRELLRANYGF
jgi:hypothetical protein